MNTEPSTRPATTDPPRPPRSVLTDLAATWSLLTTALGVWWWAQPGASPLVPDPGGPEPAGSLLAVLPAAAVGPLLVAAGIWGLGVAGPARRHDRLVVATGAVYAVGFGLAAPGMQPLVLTGYLMAMFGPIVLTVTLVAGAWRRRGGLTIVAVLVLVGVAAWVAGVADADVLRGYVGVVAANLPRFGPPAALLLLLAGGLLWGALAARTALGGRAGRPAPAWTRPAAAARWGRVATVVAAACALPYGLQRLTWLTPWPVGFEADALAENPEMRLHGILLGLAALAGAVLTLGLIARWGEMWPRWMPGLRGRPVPVAAAVVPGALVATLFTTAAVPMTAMWIEAGQPWAALVFPFPLWGPALGAAVLAYALRRRAARYPGRAS